MFLLVRQVDLVDQLDQDDVTGRYLWAEPPMRVGIRRVHKRRSNRFLLCDFLNEILLIIFRHLIWTNGCYMGYLRFTFPRSKRIFFLLNYLCKQKHMMRFYINPPLPDILGYPKFHLGNGTSGPYPPQWRRLVRTAAWYLSSSQNLGCT